MRRCLLALLALGVVSLAAAQSYDELSEGEPEPFSGDPFVEPATDVSNELTEEIYADGGESWLGPWNSNYRPRLGLGHTSQGVGYARGYTHLDGFAPLFEMDGAGLTFLDTRLLIDNGGEFGSNLGLFHRQLYYVGEGERTFGGGIAYDSRRTFTQEFHQLTFSLESLGQQLDFRGNFYLPVGERTSRVLDIGPTMFNERQLLMRPVVAQSMMGLDFELGGALPNFAPWWKSFLGAYHFQKGGFDQVYGIQARTEIQIRDRAVLHGAITNDGTFGTLATVGMTFYWGGWAPTWSTPSTYVGNRLAEPIRRNHNVVVSKERLDRYVPVNNVLGNPLDVVHVNSAAAPGGNGALNTPYQTLAQAQANSSAYSLIFARANSTFNGQGITLQNGQALLGEGIVHTLPTEVGVVTLPTITPANQVISAPAITGAPGTAVTLASNNTVSGWSISGAGGSALSGTNVDNLTVHRVNASFNGGNGLDVTGVSGQVRVTDSWFERNGNLGLRVESDAAKVAQIYVDGSSFLDNTGLQVMLLADADSRQSIIFTQNSVRAFLPATETTHADLALFRTSDTAQMTARIEGNYFDDVASTDPNDASITSTTTYFQQLTLQTRDNSIGRFAVLNNQLLSNRVFLGGSPAAGPFGVNAESYDISNLVLRMNANSSTLNYAFSEVSTSIFQYEANTTQTTGTIFYYPSAVSVDVIPANSFTAP